MRHFNDWPNWAQSLAGVVLVAAVAVACASALALLITWIFPPPPPRAPVPPVTCRADHVPVYLDPDSSRPYRSICIPGYIP